MLLTNMQRKVLELKLDQQLEDLAQEMYGKTLSECSDAQAYDCVLQMTKCLTEATEEMSGEKKV